MSYYNEDAYGLGDYDDPLEHLTPKQVRELAKYIEALKRNGGVLPVDYDAEEEEDEEDSEDEAYGPAGLYDPKNFIDDEAEEY